MSSTEVSGRPIRWPVDRKENRISWRESQIQEEEKAAQRGSVVLKDDSSPANVSNYPDIWYQFRIADFARRRNRPELAIRAVGRFGFWLSAIGTI